LSCVVKLLGFSIGASFDHRSTVISHVDNCQSNSYLFFNTSDPGKRTIPCAYMTTIEGRVAKPKG